ncbi:hypothetical protein BDY21DRAFT_113607 [Lineolata rhizophorae]|uniref:Short chain dehydrogenase n=1 Tax=Lineolata rhizophorae TaxID=578093 RepID=A0A6A6NRX3_9PEZI|nr:hypothetical protein BDY21DRAFT_113607 [Lineolata rhizophorae]
MPDQTKFNKLANKHVLILGGTSGIGYGVAEACLESGAARVIVASSNSERISKAVSKLTSAYPSRASAVVGGPATDLSNQDTIDANIKALLESTVAGGKLDHVVMTAGDALKYKPIAETDMPDMIQSGMVRYFGSLLLAKHCPSYMNPGPGSSLTLTSGLMAQKPRPGVSSGIGYGAAIFILAKSLSVDLKPLRVNVISPGAVLTEFWGAFPAGQVEAMMKMFEEKMTTGVMGKVEDVAEAYIYCMKDANMAGEIVSTNGGGLAM